MQIFLKILIGVIILLGAVLAFSPKKEHAFLNADRPVVLHTYYYYPKANFYYDSTKGTYIIWDSIESAWKSSDKLPVQQSDLGKTVRIGEVMEPVWKENQDHRLIYSVSLYSDPDDFKKPAKEVAEENNSNAVAKPQKAEKKTGVRKFWERIFPPKKKKET
ncbi:MAG: hypothetical protein ACXWCG_08070 [Flavitalea sp.]